MTRDEVAAALADVEHALRSIYGDVSDVWEPWALIRQGLVTRTLADAGLTGDGLDAERLALRAALQRIAGMDYRGNPSPEQGIARAALAELDAKVEEMT